MANRLRFAQRYGDAPLPKQLDPREITAELQAKVWAAIHAAIVAQKRLDATSRTTRTSLSWVELFYDWHVNVMHRPADDYKRDYNATLNYAKGVIYSGDFGQFYNLIEMIVEHPGLTNTAKQIEQALIDSCAAWRIVGREVVPITSPEQADAVTAALATVNESGSQGAKTHLRNSAKAIADGDWAGSIRESIHAVESVARTFGDANTLSEALKTLQSASKPIHPALAKGLNALYGYTSDEKGVRHALLDTEAAAVGENEALFLFGACASFCQYLINAAKT